MCIGHTLGEEIIFRKQDKAVKAIASNKNTNHARTESVIAKTPSCVLQVSTRNFMQLRRLKDRTQIDGTAFKDFVILKYILDNHFVQKNQWRAEAGIFGEAAALKAAAQQSQ